MFNITAFLGAAGQHQVGQGRVILCWTEAVRVTWSSSSWIWNSPLCESHIHLRARVRMTCRQNMYPVKELCQKDVYIYKSNSSIPKCVELSKTWKWQRTCYQNELNFYERLYVANQQAHPCTINKEKNTGGVNELNTLPRATKLEMARLMNRETCFKDILEKRDSIISELDVRLAEIQKNSEDRRRYGLTLKINTGVLTAFAHKSFNYWYPQVLSSDLKLEVLDMT